MEDKNNAIPTIQQKVKELYKANGWDTEPTLLLLAMQEELGELAARWLAEHPEYRKDITDTDSIADDVGDLSQLILAFCNNQGLNFEQCVKKAVTERRKNHLRHIKEDQKK